MRGKGNTRLCLERPYSVLKDLDLIDSAISEIEGQVYRLNNMLDMAKEGIACLKTRKAGSLFTTLTRFDVN